MPEIQLSTGGDAPAPPPPGVYASIAVEQVFRAMRFPIYDENGRTDESEERPGLQYVFALVAADGALHHIRSKPMKYFDRPHERSAMAKFFQAWMGELPGTTEAAVGQTALLTTGTDATGVYARINNITPLPPSMAADANAVRLALQPTLSPAEAQAAPTEGTADQQPAPHVVDATAPATQNPPF